MASPENLLDDSTYDVTGIVSRFQSRQSQMVEELAALVDLESPSNSVDQLRTCANYLASLGTSLLGQMPERIEVEGRQTLVWKFGDTPRVVLVGHYDTVHPVGTVLRFPFSVDGDVARGPGVCDMKGGVIIALHALHDMINEFGSQALDGVCLLINGDEEIGSKYSQGVIEQLANTARFAIGFENAGPLWQIKTERRGASHYEVKVKGRAAHAGDRSDKGINALREMCAQCEEVIALGNDELGTSVTPTMAAAGTAINTVTEDASMWFDVRTRTLGEQNRIDQEIRKLQPRITEAEVWVEGGVAQPPLPAEASAELKRISAESARELGLGELDYMSVGGAADVCRFAAAGVGAIDGFGAVGGDDHSDREWIYLSSLPRQAALAAGVIRHLLRGDELSLDD